MPNIAEIISNEDYTKLVNRQKETQSFLEIEIQRLESKKANMDDKEENAKRLILLNTSYRDKQNKYLVLMTLFVLIFGACLILVFMQERLGYSSGMIDWILIFIVGIGFISAYYLFQNIQSRDAIDFSKLNDTMLLPPEKMKDGLAEEKKKGDLTGIASELCRGEECCGPGYIFHTTNKKCCASSDGQNCNLAPT